MKVFFNSIYPTNSNKVIHTEKSLTRCFAFLLLAMSIVFVLTLAICTSGCSKGEETTSTAQAEPQPLSVYVGESSPVLFYPVFSSASELDGYKFYYKTKEGAYEELDKFNTMKDVCDAIVKARKANSNSFQPLYYKNEGASLSLKCFGIVSRRYEEVVASSNEDGSGLTLTDSFKDKYLVDGVKCAIQESSWGWNQSSPIQVDSIGAFKTTSYNTNSPLVFGVKYPDPTNSNGIYESYQKSLSSFRNTPVGSCLKEVNDLTSVAYYFDPTGSATYMKEQGVKAGWVASQARGDSHEFILVKEFNSESAQSDNNSSSQSDSTSANQSTQVNYPAGSYSRKGGATIQSFTVDANGNVEYTEYVTTTGEKSTGTYKLELKSQDGQKIVYTVNKISGVSTLCGYDLTYDSSTQSFSDGAALTYDKVS